MLPFSLMLSMLITIVASLQNEHFQIFVWECNQLNGEQITKTSQGSIPDQLNFVIVQIHHSY